jgi:hypothetical protein
MLSFSPYVACHTEHWLCRVLKVQVFLAQLRERRNALTELDIEQSKVDRKLKAHQKRLTKTSKSIQMLYSSMMVWMHRNLHSSITQGTCSQVGAFECLPLGILQIIYSMRVAERSPKKINLMGMLGLRAITDDNFGMCSGTASLVTTWFMFGSKVAKVICMLILILHLVLKIDV